MPRVELDRETLEVAAQMVYRRWTEEWDALKKVKEEKYDGSKDWQEFHRHRLEYCTRMEAKWKKHKDAMVKVLSKLSESHDGLESREDSPKT